MEWLIALLIALIEALGGVAPTAEPAEPVIVEVEAPPAMRDGQPVIVSPCFEDEIAMVQHHTYEPSSDDRGYWDGDRYYRLCIPVDDL